MQVQAAVVAGTDGIGDAWFHTTRSSGRLILWLVLPARGACTRTARVREREQEKWAAPSRRRNLRACTLLIESRAHSVLTTLLSTAQSRRMAAFGTTGNVSRRCRRSYNFEVP